jgi:hypothetical protein
MAQRGSMKTRIIAALLALLLAAPAAAQTAVTSNGSSTPGHPVTWGNAQGSSIVDTPILGPNVGGTGNATLPANSLLLGRTTSPIGAITPSSPGQLLIDQGAGLDPAFKPISGAITINSGGVTTFIGGSGNFIHITGAVGDNVVDDTNALQTWLNTCSAGRTICYFDPPSVCYKITSALTITSANGATIMGPGRDKVGSGICLNSTTQNGIVATTLGQINLSGFRITGQASATAGDMFQLNSGAGTPNQRSTIRDMYFLNGFNQFHPVSASGWTVDNDLFVGPTTNGASILIEDTVQPDAGDQVIQASTFSGNAVGTAIVQQSAGGLKVVGNKIINYNSGYILQLASGVATSDLFFSANSMEAFATNGIVLNKGTGTNFGTVVIVGNEINGCINCFVTDSTAGWLNNLIFTNNIVAPASGTGISVGGAGQFIVARNLVQTSGGSNLGINIGANASNGRVEDNHFNTITTPYSINSASTLLVDPFGNFTVAGGLPTVRNGSQIFITDAAPGTACTGSSTGSMAFRQNGAWKCF